MYSSLQLTFDYLHRKFKINQDKKISYIVNIKAWFTVNMFSLCELVENLYLWNIQNIKIICLSLFTSSLIGVFD